MKIYAARYRGKTFHIAQENYSSFISTIAFKASYVVNLWMHDESPMWAP